ncbi:MAG TPA: peptidoglycan bridge formation glycyltransferase FemA/FemB family protein [Ideonella sp.]|nr:peptidoglycan bridge formation glycyltransferase FemA/FemB family protein [Ideonella sp.]
MTQSYQFEVDGVAREAWQAVVGEFDDANLYQTWPYEALNSHERHMSHLVVRQGGEVVAAAQVRIQKIPVLNRGVAYVRWGPMCRRVGRETDTAALAAALEGLREEYAHRRRLSLRILPQLFAGEEAGFERVMAASGFVPTAAETAQRTLVMSLAATPEQLRKGLNQKWRNCLNQAERNGLTVTTGTDDDLFSAFHWLYDQMHTRKAFGQRSDIGMFRAVQGALPAHQKMRISIARSGAQVVAGLVCSRIGATGLYLFGATGDQGLHSKASYLLQWQNLLQLKQAGAACYNLHGINPTLNPGTYHFKAGLCGKNGRDVHYLGPHEATEGAANRLLFRVANSSRLAVRRARVAVHAWAG